MNTEAAAQVIRRSLARHAVVDVIRAEIDPRTNPAQALLRALSAMEVSQDDIANTARALGFALNPSTVARIAAGDRSRCEDRVKVALCYVYGVALCLLEDGIVTDGPLYDRAMKTWRDVAEAIFLGQMIKAENSPAA